jgi:uncharacterized membrane protein YozB (DUF420 family)
VGEASIDVRLAFWSWALANMLLVVACAVLGVRHVRAGRADSHRRNMLAAGGLVALFLVAYVVKVLLLGREDRTSWDESARWVLYLHEACVAVMLLAAGTAVTLARRFGNVRDGEPLGPDVSERSRRLHRRAGGVAISASLIAVVTAVGVWLGMFARAGA